MHASSAVYLQSVVITMTIRVLKWFSMPGSISEVADVQGVKKLVKHGHKSSCFLDFITTSKHQCFAHRFTQDLYQ